MRWASAAEDLRRLQQTIAESDGVPAYPAETPIVYNRALDEITAEDDIKLIIVGDNPGKDEQLAKNCRYLVGQSGKTAENFFRRNPELGIDFRKNVIILNKTPLHTAKTKELARLSALNRTAETILRESQLWMAEHTACLHRQLFAYSRAGTSCALWLVGYAELKSRGIFLPYRDRLLASYTAPHPQKNVQHPACAEIYVFQHFSMNRFFIDLKQHTDPLLSLEQNIRNVGILHRNEILGTQFFA